MPEIKNTFIKGKMNKDLDARLIPNGEYVDAKNIHISKSENSDVGVVQNVKGSSLAGARVDDEGGPIPGTVIGYIAESESKNSGNKIYYFFKAEDASKDTIFVYDTANPTMEPNPICKGSFLNFNIEKPITGVNLIDGLLFWTDDFNPPRKINVETAEANPAYYNNEDKISVAKYFPFSAPKVLNGTNTGLQKSTTTQVATTLANSPNVTLSTSNNNIYTGQVVSGTGLPTNLTVKVKSISGVNLVLTENATSAVANTTLSFASQKVLLEEKFVRFAYRFKFKDGEYSLISPFTQTCFIPKTYNSLPGLTNDQIKDAYISTEVDSMTNDISNIFLQIDLPTANVWEDYEIEKIEILFKESDNAAIKALAAEYTLRDHTLPSALQSSPPVYNSNINGLVYTYEYKSTLPYKTLPEDQITRVYDNVPLKAKAQEIAGNRVMYGNFEQNITVNDVDFEAFVDFRTDSSEADQNWKTQYPYQTIKSRRTYQIGLVLADKYGRQSSVILPPDPKKSTVSVPAFTGDARTNWTGNCLKISFISKLPTDWYSWKVVVKQTEQDYYNVYGPAAKDGIPVVGATIPDGTPTTYVDGDQRTWLVLHSDNVNKIPRDSNMNIQEDTTSPSNIRLYPQIVNASIINVPSSSEGLVNVISIGTAKDQNLTGVNNINQSDGIVSGFFYDSAKNPLVAELPNGYGATQVVGTSQALGVWETKPIDSALDIYYETSLTGLVSELNADLDQGSTGPSSISLNNSTFPESYSSGVLVIGNLTASDSSNNALGSVTFTLLSVHDSNNQLVTPMPFGILGNSLRVINGGYYHYQNGESFTAKIRATVSGAPSHDQNLTITTSNVAPSFSSSLQTDINMTHFSVGDPSAPGGSAVSGLNIGFNAKNGSGDSNRDTRDLTFSIVSVHLKTLANGNAVNPPQEIQNQTLFTLYGTELQNASYFAVSEIGKVFAVVVRVTDAAGATTDHTVNITISRLILSNYLESVNFNGLCSPSTTTLYLTKSSASSSGAIQVGDIIYIDLNGTITPYSGHVITATSSPNTGYGYYAKTIGGSTTGEVAGIFERDCNPNSGGGSGSGGGPPNPNDGEF